MAVYFQKPRVFSTEEMFIFWAQNLRKEKPHLIIKNLNNNTGHRSKPIELWYEVKEELAHLQQKNLELDADVQRLEIIDTNTTDHFTPVTKLIFKLKETIEKNKVRIRELEKLPGNTKQMILDYTTFKKIIVAFNKKAADVIIAGKTLNLGNKLGFSQIRKIIPPVRSQRIDWAESMQLKRELIEQGVKVKSELHPNGSNWLVFKNQNYYLRWSWVKRSNRDCTVKNNRVYAFYPTNSAKDVPGNKTKLALANQKDSLLHTRYPTVDLLQYMNKPKSK